MGDTMGLHEKTWKWKIGHKLRNKDGRRGEFRRVKRQREKYYIVVWSSETGRNEMWRAEDLYYKRFPGPEPKPTKPRGKKRIPVDATLEDIKAARANALPLRVVVAIRLERESEE